MAPKNPPNAGAGDEEGADPSFEVTPEVMRQLMASGNPQLVQALQSSLNRLVGTSSGYIESLPKPVQRRIEFVRDIEDERTTLEEQYIEEKRALEQKYAKLYEPLYAKRSAVVTGELEVPENQTDEAKAEDEGDEESPAGIPDFWQAALSNHPALEEEITEKDAEVLSYLQDVKAEELDGQDENGEDLEGFRLVFTFKPNPYFTNEQLIKTYHLGDDDDEVMLAKVEGTEIKWNTGKNVTVKVMKKKPKPGAKSSAKPQTKVEEVQSFFNWFTAPEIPDDDADITEEEMEALEEEMHNDFGLAQVIKEKIIPHALSWFTGEALQDYMDDEDDEDEDDEDGDDEDEEGDDDDEEEEEDSDDEEPAKGGKRGGKEKKGAPADAGAQPQECKQQ